MRKFFYKMHLWLSVPFGLIISLVCFSGAMLVFETEVMELCRPHLYFVEHVEKSPLPMDQLVEKVTETLPDSVIVTSVAASSNPERTWLLALSKPRRAAIYVDPYTAEVKGKKERTPFFSAMFRLHRWLLDSTKHSGGIFWGKIVVGTATLMFVFVLISGLFIWAPRSLKALRNSLKITVKKGWRRFCYTLHVAGGVYACVLLLAMAATGLTWSFQWYRTGFYRMLGTELSSSASHRQAGGASSRTQKEKSLIYWQDVYNRLVLLNPGYKQITVSNASATVSFDRLGNQRAVDHYKFNPDNGQILETTFYKNAPKSGKIRGWIYSVHVGNWGGLFTRLLSFIAALLGAVLPLTGYYLWMRKKYSKQQRIKRAFRGF